jgi:transcriptional regulator with XRE-family HTH domain
MDDQGNRLLRLREAMGISTQTAMAVALGIEVSRWNNFERSHSPLSLDVANRICARFPGVTLDWLIRGNPSGLPLDLAKRLGELPSANPSRRRRR